MCRYFALLILFIGCWGCERKVNSNKGAFRSQIIFPYQGEHVHGSAIVKLPDGDLLAAWFQGSGERWADDVRIMGARLMKGDTAWSETFLMADVPGFPDINPTLFMDKEDRLWLMWYPVLANQWETSIPMYRISEDHKDPGPPVWKWQNVLFVKPGDKTERGIQPDDRFVKGVATQLEEYETYLKGTLMGQMPDSVKAFLVLEWEKYKQKLDSLSKGRNMVRSGRIKQGEEEIPAELG